MSRKRKLKIYCVKKNGVLSDSLCASLYLDPSSDPDVKHHVPLTEVTDERRHHLLSPQWQTRSWLSLFVWARVGYLLPSLNLLPPVALAFLGLHQHCQFVNRDGQRHKEISWLSKRKGQLKMHAGAFCHYGAISGCRLTIRFNIMEINESELIHYGCPLVSCSGWPLCHF